jgi:hypothetical protein
MLKKSFDSARGLSKNDGSKNEHSLLLLITAAILLFFTIIFTVYYVFIKEGAKQALDNPLDLINTSTVKTYQFFSQLTGLGEDDEMMVKPSVVAVMIDNNPDTYPQFGLNEAVIVYEAPVEGGITRLMALYPASSTIKQVGPVRSARPYYLDWLAEYGSALYMHCGGSPEGLDLIKSRQVFNANEFFRSSYYWRDKTKIAPHNLFTSSDKWQRYLSDYKPRNLSTDWSAWNFGQIASSSNSEIIKSFEIEYLVKHHVGWRYDSQADNYERTINGEIVLNEFDQPITTSNVIVQFSSIRIIDEVGRRRVSTISEGEARIFRNGQMVRGTWKKENLVSRTRFYDQLKNEVVLSPGRTWLMIVPEKTKITITN